MQHASAAVVLVALLLIGLARGDVPRVQQLGWRWRAAHADTTEPVIAAPGGRTQEPRPARTCHQTGPAIKRTGLAVSWLARSRSSSLRTRKMTRSEPAQREPVSLSGLADLLTPALPLPSRPVSRNKAPPLRTASWRACPPSPCPPSPCPTAAAKFSRGRACSASSLSRAGVRRCRRRRSYAAANTAHHHGCAAWPPG